MNIKKERFENDTIRKLYLFVNHEKKGLLHCSSLTDDGYILGDHACSNINFMKLDLHDRTDCFRKINEHFKGESYEVRILSYDECFLDEDFQKAFKLSQDKIKTPL